MSEPGNQTLTELEQRGASVEDSSHNVLRNLADESDSLDHMLVVDHSIKDMRHAGFNADSKSMEKYTKVNSDQSLTGFLQEDMLVNSQCDESLPLSINTDKVASQMQQNIPMHISLQLNSSI